MKNLKKNGTSIIFITHKLREVQEAADRITIIRRGKVVGVRYGDIIFKSTDNKEPILDGSHYSPYQLQKRIR